MKSILIKDTTKQERIALIKEWLPPEDGLEECEIDLWDMYRDYIDGKMLYITHGHHHNPQNPPMINKGDILMNGHTHISADERYDGFRYLNPGSVSIPKNGTGHSYMIYENGEFTLKNLI